MKPTLIFQYPIAKLEDEDLMLEKYNMQKVIPVLFLVKKRKRNEKELKELREDLEKHPMMMYSVEERYNKIKDEEIFVKDDTYPQNIIDHVNTLDCDYALLDFNKKIIDLFRDKDYKMIYLVPSPYALETWIGTMYLNKENRPSLDDIASTWFDDIQYINNNQDLFPPENIVRDIVAKITEWTMSRVIEI